MLIQSSKLVYLNQAEEVPLAQLRLRFRSKIQPVAGF